MEAEGWISGQSGNKEGACCNACIVAGFFLLKKVASGGHGMLSFLYICS